MTKIKYIGKCKIYDNKYIIKEEKDLKKIYKYLESRDFSNYLNIIERNNNNNKYDYLIDNSLSKEQKLEDLAIIVASLHNKTSYHKEVNLDKYSEIYDNTLGYINYVDFYYKNIINNIEYKEYNSPSEILLLSNYYKLNEVIIYLKSELKNWFELVKEKRKARVVLTHGNLQINHLINDKLISWENSSFDTPIIDIVKLFKNEWDNVDLSNFLNIYLDKCKYTDEELKLLFINLSIPLLIKNSNDEFKNVCNVRKLYDYLFKVESLIRPYYSKEKNE